MSEATETAPGKTGPDSLGRLVRLRELAEQMEAIKGEIRTESKSRLRTYGQRLRTLRKRRGMTQDALALQVGLGRPQLCMIENGKTTSLPTLLAMCDVLEVTPNDLLGYSSNT